MSRYFPRCRRFSSTQCPTREAAPPLTACPCATTSTLVSTGSGSGRRSIQIVAAICRRVCCPTGSCRRSSMSIAECPTPVCGVTALPHLPEPQASSSISRRHFEKKQQSQPTPSRCSLARASSRWRARRPRHTARRCCWAAPSRAARLPSRSGATGSLRCCSTVPRRLGWAGSALARSREELSSPGCCSAWTGSYGSTRCSRTSTTATVR